MLNYYEILGVSRSADKTEIKAVYKKLALQYHPDKNIGNKAIEEKFKTINEAYQTLSDETKRNSYNSKLDYYLFQQQQRKTTSHTSNTGTVFASDPYKTYYSTVPEQSNDFSTQGKHYQEPSNIKKERKYDHYILALTLFIIIATGSLLFGFMMNNITAKAHYQKAVVHYETEDYIHAIMELNQAIEFNDSYADAYLLRADIKMHFKKYDSALPDYNLAIRYSENIDQQVLVRRDLCKSKIHN